MYSKRSLFVVAALAIAGSAFADLNILVYDHDSNNSFAVKAASQVSGSVTVGNSFTFNNLLTTGSWDLVLIDCPGGDTAWTDTTNYVLNGGKVAMSYWRWEGEDALRNAFGATDAESMSWSSNTLYAHNSSFFSGVSMPNSDWNDSWSSDGAIFTGITGTSLAGLTKTGETTMFLGNSGRTIAMSLVDEAGASWIDDGSAVQIWKNSITTLTQPVPEPATLAALGLGAMALVRRKRKSSG